MKSEQERVEKEMPAIHIHNEGVDLGDINRRLQELKGFKEKKQIIEGELVKE